MDSGSRGSRSLQYSRKEDEGSNEATLKVELTNFAAGLHVGYHRKRGIKDDSSGLS